MGLKAGLLALSSLAALALTASEMSAQARRAPGVGPALTDIVISSYQGTTAVASGALDARGQFRLDLPPGDHTVCVGLTGGSSQPRSDNSTELLVVIAIAGQAQLAEQRVSLRAGASGDANAALVVGSRGGPCFPLTVRAVADQDRAATRGGANPSGSVGDIPAATTTFDVKEAFSGPRLRVDRESPTVAGQDREPRRNAPAVNGDSTGEGRRERAGIPVAAPEGTNLEPAPLLGRTVAVTGTVRMVR